MIFSRNGGDWQQGQKGRVTAGYHSLNKGTTNLNKQCGFTVHKNFFLDSLSASILD